MDANILTQYTDRQEIENQIRANSIISKIKNPQMHMQTTLILSSSHCSFKTNQRSEFSNFSHPLKVLQKTDNDLMEMRTKQAFNATGVSNTNAKSARSTNDNFRENKTGQSQSSTSAKTSKQPQCFNEDEGILEHIYHKMATFNSSPHSKLQSHSQSHFRSTKQGKWFSAKPSPHEQKCIITFGFSINLLEIENFHLLHPQLNLNISFYHYEDNDYFREVDIKSLEEESCEENPQKYQKILEVLDGEDLLDCEEVSFVVSYWPNGEDITHRDSAEQKQANKKKTYIYFFPNINALKSEQERKQQKTQLTLGLPISSTTHQRRKDSVASNEAQNPHQTMTSLRKSHQNFRVLQVLEYYLKLECHSEHIMITSNESRIMKEFMDLVYQQSIKVFFVYIDHERKTQMKTTRNTAKSIMGAKNQQDHFTKTKNQRVNSFMSHNNDHCTTTKHQNDNSFMSHDNDEAKNDEFPKESLPSSKVYTTDICSQKQFISIDGELIINDQFLSKLSELKLAEPWLDSVEFREQKKAMYKMKLQEYTENKELKRMKDEFTDSINYLKSLIGLQKVSYEQISIESLKVIKNAKIRQATQQAKQLQNIWQQKQIRNQELKLKLKQYQTQKHAKNQDCEQNLSQLRKDIMAVQKQLNLHRNQLSAIYDASGQKENQKMKTRADYKGFVKHSNQQGYSGDTQLPERSNERQATRKVTVKSNIRDLKPQGKLAPSTQHKPKPTAQLPTTLSQKDEKPADPLQTAHTAISSFLRTSKAPLRAQSFLINRRSSQLLSKYAPVLQQLRKQKYEQSLKQQMTKCEFQAEKDFEKYKEEYIKVCKQLRNVLNDCD